MGSPSGSSIQSSTSPHGIRRAGCVIVDVDSNEELSDLLVRLPVAAYMEWEVVPLIPADKALDAAKWALQHTTVGAAR